MRFASTPGDALRATISRGRSDGAIELVDVACVVPADAAARATPLVVEWDEPLDDAVCVWTTAAGRDKGLPPEWGDRSVTSKTTSNAPLVCIVGARGDNRTCIAASDTLFESKLSAGVHEESGTFRCRYAILFAGRTAGSRVEVTLRIDRRRDVRYERALADASAYWESLPGHRPAPVPAVARAPMYSTWYAYHQALDPARIEEECRLARDLGCEAVILDDGWQTLDTSRGYAHCGDWEPERIPDLAGHVARVHALGMKVVLWFAVPWIGKESRAFARFRDKLLYVHEGLGAGVLDPRSPEVRELLIDTYERAMRAWKLDGFKLDFVDRFKATDATPPGDSVEPAVDRLLADVIARLRAIDPEVLVEFRQPYVGPLMRKYGNMFRAADCPADYVRNRVSTIDVRLLCGSTACHADMIMWGADERVEPAALQVLAVLFSVPQISMRLGEIPPTHVAMLRHWLAFWREHRATLLDGELRAEAPEQGYPLVTAAGAEETIVAAYAPWVVPVAEGRRCFVVNATLNDSVVIELRDRRAFRTFDTQGAASGSGELAPGLHRVAVPRAGLVVLSA